MKQQVSILLIAAIAMAFAFGCAKPPKAERELAEKAFRSAAIGKDCDKENYLAAEELLNKAREEINKKNYDKARELFLKVKEKSDAIVKYYQTHPDECLPKEEVVEKEVEEEVDEITNPAEDTDLDFPVIHFELDQYDIREEDMAQVEMMAKWMLNFEEKVVRIEGHADERGSVDYNMSLGEKRASEVKNNLIQLGVDAKRIKIVSYGEEKPVDSASNDEAWYENRRAEFKRVN